MLTVPIASRSLARRTSASLTPTPRRGASRERARERGRHGPLAVGIARGGAVDRGRRLHRRGGGVRRGLQALRAPLRRVAAGAGWSPEHAQDEQRDRAVRRRDRRGGGAREGCRGGERPGAARRAGEGTEGRPRRTRHPQRRPWRHLKGYVQHQHHHRRPAPHV